MKTARFLVIGLICFFPYIYLAQSSSLTGLITDSASGETIPFSNVVIYNQKGETVAGGSTDFDGRFNINPIEDGIYDIRISFVGMHTTDIDNFLVIEGENRLNAQLIEDPSAFRNCCFCCCIRVSEETTEDTRIVVAGPFTGLNSRPSSAPAAYPNPTTGFLQYTAPAAAKEVLLTDMQGRLVHREIPNKEGNLDLTDLPRGNYLLQFTGSIYEPIQIIKH